MMDTTLTKNENSALIPPPSRGEGEGGGGDLEAFTPHPNLPPQGGKELFLIVLADTHTDTNTYFL